MRIFSENAVAMSVRLLPVYEISPTSCTGQTPLSTLHLRDDLVAHRRGRRLVAIEVHRVRAAALGTRADVGRVAEHLRERHTGIDDLRPAACFHRLNVAAAAVQVADD